MRGLFRSAKAAARVTLSRSLTVSSFLASLHFCTSNVSLFSPSFYRSFWQLDLFTTNSKRGSMQETR